MRWGFSGVLGQQVGWLVQLKRSGLIMQLSVRVQVWLTDKKGTIPVLASPVLSLLCYCFVSIAAGQISRYGQEEHLAERLKHCLCDADPGCIKCEPLCEWSCGWMNLRIKEVATAVVSYRWGRRSWGRPLVSTFNGYGMLAVNTECTHLLYTWCKGRVQEGRWVQFTI